MGTALVATVMTSRALALTDDGVSPVAASLEGTPHRDWTPDEDDSLVLVEPV